MAHNVFVEETDNGFRWECSCRKSGKVVKSRPYAEELSQKHVARYAPKAKGPKTLRDLLRLDGD